MEHQQQTKLLLNTEYNNSKYLALAAYLWVYTVLPTLFRHTRLY